MKKEACELEVRKIMKEKFNIEIPERHWIFPILESSSNLENPIEGMTRDFLMNGGFEVLENIYVVIGDRDEWGFLDAGKGIYVEPMCYDVSVKDKYIVMNEVMPTHEDGSKSYFHHCFYDTQEGKFSVDFKTTKEFSKQCRKLSEELFVDDAAIGVQAHDSGYQTISVNEKMGLISEDTLTRYIEPQYDALMLAWGDVEELCNQITKQDQIYCVVKNNGKFGVVDLKNNLIIPIEFDSFDDLEAYCKEKVSGVEA